ncbi:hypothetical protein USB125703_02126 [Pseudoclavibacter triregionum]|nr:hypothetical protein USB125703_02126 [Pseudoclavibacter triregionum]
MRAMTSSTGSFFDASAALRPGPARTADGRDATAAVDEIAELPTPSGAIYLGPLSGRNSEDGVVLKAPAAGVRVIATRSRAAGEAPTLLSLSFVLGEAAQGHRGAVPADSYWSATPGEIPVLESSTSLGPIIACDAGLRDLHRDGAFPWDDWSRDAVAPQLDDTLHPDGGCAAATFPGRSEYLIALADTRGVERSVAVLADLDDAGRPIAYHLDFVLADRRDGGAAEDARSGAGSIFGSEGGEGLHRAETSEAPSIAGPGAAGMAGPGAQAGAPASAFGRPDPFSAPSADDAPIHAGALGTGALGAAADHRLSFGPAAGQGMASGGSSAVAGATSVTALSAGHAPTAPSGPSTADRLREAYRLLDADDADPAIPLLHGVLRELDGGALADPETQRALAEREFTPATLADLVCDLELETHRDEAARNTLRRALGAPSLADAPLEAVHLARRLGELELAADRLPQAVGALEMGRGTVQAFLAQSQGQDREAIEFAAHNEAQLSFLLADARMRMSDAASAAQLAAGASARFAELERDAFAGRAALLAAAAHWAQGAQEQRAASLREAERLFRRGDRRDGLGIALGFLAQLDAEAGDYRPAIAKLIEARDVLDEAGLLEDAATASDDLALCFEKLGEGHAASEARRAGTLLRSRIVTSPALG